MPYQPKDLSKIRHVESGDPVAGPVTSQPTRAIELRLKHLEDLISAQSSSVSGQLVIYGVAVASNVVENRIVYFNANTGLYELAIAGVTFASDSYQFLSTSLAIGLVLKKSGTKADIMIGGYSPWQGASQKQDILEGTERFKPGVAYYLSSKELGKITRVPPTLRIQILVSTQEHFVFLPAYSSPDSIESVTKVPIGMRPVGSLRKLSPLYSHSVVVGFDALEQVFETDWQTNLNDWQTTEDSNIAAYRNYGYMVADASVDAQPSSPVFVRINVDTAGNISAFSAATLAQLWTSGTPFNLLNYPTPLTETNFGDVRTYIVTDLQNQQLGTISFKFTAGDASRNRSVVFKFPDSFQGWKMLNTLVAPSATAVIRNGQVDHIVVNEGSIGFDTPPSVRLTGTVKSVAIVDGGSGYPPNVTVQIAGGGGSMGGATATATVSNGVITEVQITNPGSGFLVAPQVTVLEESITPAVLTAQLDIGNGTGAVGVAVLNEFGSIIAVTVDETLKGHDYDAPPQVLFDSRVSGIILNNGGSGAVVMASVDTQGSLQENLITIQEKGYGYNLPPSLKVVDAVGSGYGAELRAHVKAGRIDWIEVIDGGNDYVTPRVVVNPDGNSGYEVTKQGSFTINYLNNTIDSVTVVDGGYNYPKGATVRFIRGGGTGAEGSVVLDDNGTILAINVTNPGDGYGATTEVDLDLKDPALIFEGGDPQLAAEGEAKIVRVNNVSMMQLASVEVKCAGGLYSPATTLTAVGGLLAAGTAAELRPIIEAGRISRVIILNPGLGYFSNPQIVINDPGALGHGAILTPKVSSPLEMLSLTNRGEGYAGVPVVKIGQGISVIEVEDGGSGYIADPVTWVELPGAENVGVTALATARIGGTITQVRVLNGGQNYIAPAAATIQIGDGSSEQTRGAVLIPIFNANAELETVEIINGGHGFQTAPSLLLVGGDGIGAVLDCVIDGIGKVVAIEVARAGTRYTEPPAITVDPPKDLEGSIIPSGRAAIATAKLSGGGVSSQVVLSGSGGNRILADAAPVVGNAMQITNFADDMSNAKCAGSTKPKHAVFYYNMGADPNFRSRYPAVPVDKCSFLFNGTELLTSPLAEATGLFKDSEFDVGLSKNTLFWHSCHNDGSPWASAYRQFILEFGATGTDQIVPGTGAPGDEDNWWRWWEHLFRYEPLRNRAWLHVNRASRFHQSSKVVSLGALAPLRLIDVATGTDASNDGSPMTGQLMLTLDNQVNLLGGTLQQVDTTKTNDLVAIYQNTTGRQVFISSVLLTVVFQKNAAGLVPLVDHCAKITIGTQAGNYRNIIGTADPNIVTQTGVETRLYAINQTKELLPDAREAYTMIGPNEKVFLRIETPVSQPILGQILVARIKGHIF